MTAGLVPTAAPAPLEPELICWALLVEHLAVVLVLEPSYRVDGPPGVHLALSARPAVVDGVLAANGWRPRGWLRRSWGRLARVDLARQLEHDDDLDAGGRP